MWNEDQDQRRPDYHNYYPYQNYYDHKGRPRKKKHTGLLVVLVVMFYPGGLAQLVLEDALEDLEEVLEFSYSVGLPICFADLGYAEVEPDVVRNAAEKACVPGSTIHNMPFEVTGEMVYHALMAADAYGRAYYAKKNG